MNEMTTMQSDIPDNNTLADFCIEIQYQKASENPSRIFRSISSLIDSCQTIDSHLVKSIDVNIEPVLLLEDVETGSVKVWLSNRLKQIPDDSLYKLDWRPIVGQYLVKAKYIIINFLTGKTKITNINELKPVIEDIFRLAEETKVRHLPAYTRPEPRKLLEGIRDISASLSPLTKEDSATYYNSRARG